MLADPGPSTLSVHGGAYCTGRLVTPLVRASAHADDAGWWRYSRFSNPTVEAVAARIAALEGAPAGALVASGTAAIACALLAATPPGGIVVAAREVCGDALMVLSRQLPELGRRVTFVDVDDLDGWSAALAASDATAAYAETVSNPGLRIADVPAIAAAARAGGAVLVVDATLSTPINQRPLDHGAALVVHSAGKYLNGHADLVAGAIAGHEPGVTAVREVAQRLGASLDPGAASLLERGLKTLGIRMQRHAATALAVAEHLAGSAAVRGVRYPHLLGHPDRRLAARLLRGGSGVIAFTLRDGDVAARTFAGALRLIGRAPTLGAAESLIWLPGIDRHPAEMTAVAAPGFVRLSVGLEDAGDLIDDLRHALAAAGSAVRAGAA
jgi:cystathionine beta-lyase/cystathionine gamma-synthase